MKRILLMLGVLGLVHFNAYAQVGSGVENNPGSQGGEKLDVIVGTKKNTATQPAPAPQRVAPAPVAKMPVHATMHTAYHKTVHHNYKGHTYAKAGTRKPMHHTTMHHAVAMHHTVKHHTYTKRYVQPAPAAAYTGNMPAPAAAPAATPAPKRPVSYKDNMKDDRYKYPGASDGGWHNGTNGQSGTDAQDGDIKIDRK